jgi:hypothetical protein
LVISLDLEASPFPMLLLKKWRPTRIVMEADTAVKMSGFLEGESFSVGNGLKPHKNRTQAKQDAVNCFYV